MSFIYGFFFGEVATIIGFLANMKLYVLDILESYKDTIIFYLGNSLWLYIFEYD